MKVPTRILKITFNKGEDEDYLPLHLLFLLPLSMTKASQCAGKN